MQPVIFSLTISLQKAHTGFRHSYALQALSHALLLAPQNPFYVLEFAEIAYASGDVPLAIRTFLLVVDMTDDEDAPITSYQMDITLRAWYGVKLVCRTRVARDGQLTAFAEPAPLHIGHTVAISDLAPQQCRADRKACNGAFTAGLRAKVQTGVHNSV